MYNMEICFGCPCKSHSFSSLSMVWLHLTGRKVGAQKQIGSKYVMPKALRAMPKATCPWSMHGLHVRKAMGAKPKALGAKMEAIKVACQKQWVLKLVLSKQCTWRRCCGNLETPLVRKLLTFFHLPTHCSLWHGHCMMWPPILVLHGPCPWQGHQFHWSWCHWSWLGHRLLAMVAWWRPWPFHEGSNPWSATSDSSGSVMGSVAPYPWRAPNGTAMLCP